MVTAYQGGQVDAIVQFDVLSGKALFDDTNFSIIATSADAASPDLDADRQGRHSRTSASARRSR